MKKKSFLESPLCTLCGSKKSKIYIQDATNTEKQELFTLVKCSRCSLVFLSPRPLKERIADYYDSENYWGDLKEKMSRKNISEEREKAYGRIYNHILKDKIKRRVLDVGAGTGLFLSKFKDVGWKVEGIELSCDAISYAEKNHGIKLFQGDVSGYKEKSLFNLINVHHTLEHLYDPSKTLKKLHPLLTDNGSIVISVPNIKSFGALLFRKNWYPLQPPTHLYHFTGRTLSKLLEKNGFVITYIDYNQWHYNYYSLFESLRKTYSAAMRSDYKVRGEKVSKSEKSLKKEVMKVFATVLVTCMVICEVLTRRSEIITVYAKKAN